MGLLSGIGSVIDKVGDVAGGLLPGPIGIAVDKGSDILGGVLGSGGGRSSSQRQLPARTMQQPPQRRPATRGEATGMMFDRLQDVTPPQFQGTLQGAQQATGGQAPVQSFQQGLMMEMLSSSVRSKDGRAILEAMTSGSLQGGMIQQPHPVQTPRGVRHYSPPGFRTVEVNGQKISVFKPLARALRLLPKKSRSKLTSADMKAITKADRLTKKLKKLAKKTGRLKVTNK